MRPVMSMVRFSEMNEQERQHYHAGRLLVRLQTCHRADPDIVATVEAAASRMAELDSCQGDAPRAEALRAEISTYATKLGRADPLSGFLDGSGRGWSGYGWGLIDFKEGSDDRH